jgi:nitroreductase
MASEPDTTGRTYDEAMARLAMPLDEAMMTQRAVRRLLPDPVDDRIVLRCIELALKAPTGSNGQNWEFVVVKDPDTKATLARKYRQAWSRYHRIGEWMTQNQDTNPVARTVARASGGGNADAETMGKILRAVQWQVDHFTELPVLVVACLRGGKMPFVPQPSLQASSFYGSIYPSVQNLLLAARAAGLGASLITLPLWSLTTARKVLGLPTSVTPACIVPLGWPRGRYGPTTRRPVGDVVHLDRFGNQPWQDDAEESA